MDDTLNETEEKMLIGLLYNHVSFGTSLQVFGDAAADNQRLATLRNALERLLLKYNLLDALAPDVLLILGLVSHIPRKQLETWAQDDKNKHLQLRSQFFLKHN